MSEAEAERLGGPQLKREPELVEWRNPRTDRTMRIDRGLDPSWANNPGRDRPRLAQEAANAKIAELGLLLPAAAREAVRQFVESPLLDRQFNPGPGEIVGDLPIAFLPSLRARQLGVDARLVVLTPSTSRKQAKKHHRPNPDHPDDVPLTLDDYRHLLPEILERAPDERVAREPAFGKKGGDNLLLVYEKDGDWWKVVLGTRGQGARTVRLVTFHSLSEEEALHALKRARRRARRQARR